MKIRYIVYAAVLISVTLLAMSGTIMSQVAEPKYKIIVSENNFEIREYPPLIVAQVNVTGERKEAISDGFKLLANYIFGNNTTAQKISMTAPVQQQSATIAMTAPVLQQESEVNGQWQVRFVMPSEYTLETLPQPNNKQVQILSVPAKRYAVIRFSGLAWEDSLQENLVELKKQLATRKLEAIGEPLYAFYNPPWTLPFLRRNEIMLELKG